MPNTQFPATAEGLPNFPIRNHGSLFLEFTPDLRKRIEQTVEHLIYLLDTYDGDPDFEDNADHEPSLGFKNMPGYGAPYMDPGDDRELNLVDDEDGHDAEPNVDDEPSLAALETTMRPLDWHSRIPPLWLGGEPSGFVLKCSNGDQAGWSAGDCADMELEEGNDEPDVDEEPSLSGFQPSFSRSDTRDLELDECDQERDFWDAPADTLTTT